MKGALSRNRHHALSKNAASNKQHLFRSDTEKLRLINGFKGSGRILKQYCHENSIHVNQFYLWKRRLKPDSDGPGVKSQAFIELHPALDKGPSPFEISFGSLIRLQIPQDFQQSSIRKLLSAMKSARLL